MDIYQRLRKNIRLLRVEHDISAADLTVALGWAGKRVHDIEDLGRRINPRLDELEQLCAYFNVTIEDLFHKEAYVAFK